MSPPSRSIPARVVWLLALAGATGLLAFILAPTHAALALPGLAIELAMLAVWMVGAVGIGGWVRRRLRVAPTNVALDLATDAALGLGILSIASFLLGSVGLLNRPVAAAMLSVGVVACVREALRRRIDLQAWFDRPSAWWLLAGTPFASAMLLCAMVLPGLLWGDEPHGYDVVSYHLQLPREWYELGRITPLDHNVFSFFPLNVEMLFLLAMHLRGGPWAGMYLAQLVCAALMLVAAAGVFGALRPMGVRAASCGAIIFLAIPWTTLLGSVAYNEAGLILWGSLAVFRLMQRSDRSDWLIAGVLAGFALGTKYTALITLVTALPAVLLLTHRARLVHVILFIVVSLLVASPWLVRNTLATGNPVFPMAMNVLGAGHFDAGQIERWNVAHATRDDQRAFASRVDALKTQVIADWRYGGATILMALATVAVVRSRTRQTIALALLVVVSVAFWLAATHLQGRFLVHVIPWLVVLGVVGVGVRFVPVAAALCFVLGWVSWDGRAELISRLRAVQPAAVALQPSPDLHELILPEPVAVVLRRSDRPVALAGDARAFWCVMPMSRLRYRTVFDVPSTGDTLDGAWIGDVSPDAIVIVDPNELRRFARTYRNLPAFTGTAPGPFIMPADR